MNQVNGHISEKTDSSPRSLLAQAITVGMVIPLSAVRAAAFPIVAYWLEGTLIFAVIFVGLASKCLPIRRWSPFADSAIYYFLLASLSWVIGFCGCALVDWGMHYGFATIDRQRVVTWYVA